jgi:hypothetical protein
MWFTRNNLIGLILFVGFIFIMTSCHNPADSVDEHEELLRSSRKHHFIRLSNDGEIKWMVAYDVENELDLRTPIEIIKKGSNLIQMIYDNNPSLRTATFEIKDDSILYVSSSEHELIEEHNYYPFWKYDREIGMIVNSYGKVELNGYQSVNSIYNHLKAYKLHFDKDDIKVVVSQKLNSVLLAKNRYRTYEYKSKIKGSVPRFMILETTYDVFYDDVYQSLSLNPIYQAFKIGQFDSDSTMNFLFELQSGYDYRSYLVSNDRFGLVNNGVNYSLLENFEPNINLGSDFIVVNSKQALFATKIVNMENGTISNLSITFERSIWKNFMISDDSFTWLFRIFSPDSLKIDMIENSTGVVKKSKEFSNEIVLGPSNGNPAEMLSFELNDYKYIYID